jgi:hypothetical protein
MQPEVTPTGRAILNHLRRDATESRKVSHWDPGWIARKLSLTNFEMYEACKQLEALGLVELFDLTTFAPQLVLDQKITDICITSHGLMGDLSVRPSPRCRYGRFMNGAEKGMESIAPS